MTGQFGGYTLKERDRRWALANDFMKQQGLDALFVFGEAEMSGPGPYTLDNWITNHRPGSCVIFPHNKKPLVLSFMPAGVIDLAEATERGESPWIAAEDVRIGRHAGNVNKALQDLSLTESTIGVCGLEPFHPIHPSGIIPYTLWSQVLEANPKATFKTVGEAFYRLTLPLSDEQITVLRKAASIGDSIAHAMVKAAGVGVPENEVYAAAMAAAFTRGTTIPLIHFMTGPKAINWGPPRWHYSPQSPPRILEDGDLVASEIFSDYGKMQAQLQVTVAVGKVHPDVERAAVICRQCYDSALKAMKAGATFGEVAKAIRQPLRENEGAWSKGPLIHSLNPIVSVCDIEVDLREVQLPEQFVRKWALDTMNPDLVLEPGMSFAMEPTCALGPYAVTLGGTVVITDGEPLELNTYTTRLLRTE